MKRMKRMRMFAVLVVAALVLGACAKPPEDLIGQAREALKTAESAGAPRYAPEAWNRAKQAEASLEAELEAQSGKFTLFRSYRRAAALAEELAAASAQAAVDVNRNTRELRSELIGTIAELEALLQSARNRLASIPVTVRIDRAGLRARLNTAAERIEQARRALQGGRFDEGLSASGEAREGVRTVLRALEAAAPLPPSAKR